MKSREKSKAVTTRFSKQDYLILQEEAENRGCTIADVIRTAWNEYQTQQQFEQQLLRLEQRQRLTLFEMLCTVIDLGTKERDQAQRELEKLGVNW